MENKIKEVISSITQIKTSNDMEIGLKFTVISLPLSMALNSIGGVIIGASWEFLGVLMAVVLDTLFGTISSIKNNDFKTNKAMMVVYKLGAYFIILACLLLIEKGFPFMVWLSEAVLIPIILFQVVSALKHMANLGLLTNKQLSQILSKIDSHKNTEE